MIAIATERDALEFIEAKRRKNEPIAWDVKAVANASFIPSGPSSITAFRSALRESKDFATAHDMVDALELALRKRHGCDLPMPEEIIQNSDRSLLVAWDGVKAMFRREGIAAFVGAVAGDPTLGITGELLDALGLMARIQASQ